MSTATFNEKIIVYPNLLAAIRAELVMVIEDENFELKKNPEKWVFSLIIHLLEGATKEVSSFAETFFVRA